MQHKKIRLTEGKYAESEPVFAELALDDGGWVQLFCPALAEVITLSGQEALKLLDVLKNHEKAIREAKDVPFIPDLSTAILPPYEDETMPEQIAAREWYTKAKVRILETIKVGNPEGFECTYHAGQEMPMVQWGRAGRPVDRSHWWNNFDIDGAFIVPASKVEVLEVLEEVAP